MKAKILTCVALGVLGMKAQAQTITGKEIDKQQKYVVAPPVNYELVPGFFGISQGYDVGESPSIKRPTKLTFKNKAARENLSFSIADTNDNMMLDTEDSLSAKQLLITPLDDNGRYMIYTMDSCGVLKKFSCSAQKYEMMSKEEERKAIEEKSVEINLQKYKNEIVKPYGVDPFKLTDFVPSQKEPTASNSNKVSVHIGL